MPRGKLRFSSFFMHGVVMGLSPQDVNNMTLWEFFACLDGWKAANQTEEKAPPMSDDTLSDLGIQGF